ncbi:MAG TPA: hypothetical protein DDX71_02500 [Ruminococcus sp.]|nr:hypothetical protein [Ruminococcus sp.]
MIFTSFVCAAKEKTELFAAKQFRYVFHSRSSVPMRRQNLPAKPPCCPHIRDMRTKRGYEEHNPLLAARTRPSAIAQTAQKMLFMQSKADYFFILSPHIQIQTFPSGGIIA